MRVFAERKLWSSEVSIRCRRESCLLVRPFLYLEVALGDFSNDFRGHFFFSRFRSSLFGYLSYAFGCASCVYVIRKQDKQSDGAIWIT